jgi:5-methylthioadenosine/S-adenosylhomocysteine deaminase
MPRARLSARHVIANEEHLPNGAVLIGEDGRIEMVDADHTVPEPPGCVRRDYGDAVITPGLANFHTHLELTGLNGGRALEEPHFPAWIRRLRELKAQRTRNDFLAAAREGVRQCLRQGVTMVADTGDTGIVAQALAEVGMRGVVYQEVFGPDPVLAPDSLRALQQSVAALRQWESERVVIGVSPHAPYTVSGPLYRDTCVWAREQRLPIALHIAESAEESALLATGTGGFADAWRRRHLPMPEPLGLTPVAFLDHWGVWGSLGDAGDEQPPWDIIAIHAVRVPSDDIRLLAATGSVIAWCPLANRAHGHGDAPVLEFDQVGLPVGLGTDSELSVGAIDLVGVARAVPSMTGAPARAVATRLVFQGTNLPGGRGEVEANGALVLPGHPADLAVFRCPAGADPWEAILAPASTPTLATWLAGVEVHRLSQAEAGAAG